MTTKRTAAFSLHDLSINEGSFVDDGDNPEAHIKLWKNRSAEDPTMPTAAAWSPEFIKSLPDSAFLAVNAKGVRMFAVRDAAGAVDLPQLRAALKSIPDVDEAVRDTVTAAAKGALEQASKDYGYYGSPRTTATIIAEREFRSKFCDLKYAFNDSVSSILYATETLLTSGQLGKMLSQSTAEFEAMVGELVDGIAKASPALALEVIALVEATKAACDVAPAELASAFTKALTDLDKVASPANQESPMPTPATSPAANATNASPTTEKSLEQILAGLPAAEREKISATLAAADKAKTDAEKVAADAARSDADKAKAEVEKRLATTEAELAKMKDEALTAKFTEKARTIAGDVTEVATLLKGAYGRSDTEGAALEKTLRAMTAQARIGMKPMLKAVGSEGAGADDNGDPEAVLDAATTALMKADPKLTYADAYVQAMKAKPEAYEKHASSHGRRVAGDDA